MLSAEEEKDVEVRRVDQENINQFGRLNNRLQEIQEDKAALAKELEGLDDANTDLMMSPDNVRLLVGETYVETNEDEANEYVEKLQERAQARMAAFEAEEASIKARQEELKVELYGRFGTTINLEA